MNAATVIETPADDRPAGTFLLMALVLWALWLWRRHKIDGEPLAPFFSEQALTDRPTFTVKPEQPTLPPLPAPLPYPKPPRPRAPRVGPPYDEGSPDILRTLYDARAALGGVGGDW